MYSTTMENKIKEKEVNSKVYINLAALLLKLLEDVHKNKIYHRDIKPSNIMLRDSNLENPVLVDFGLIWQNIEEHSAITLMDENPGNKFMDLPEAFSDNAWENHSAVSDITRACGILFWLLTDKMPNGFVKANGRIHESADVIPTLIKVLGCNDSSVLTLFDVMFCLHPNHRLQSAEECYMVLNDSAPVLQDTPADSADNDEVLKCLKGAICQAFPNTCNERCGNFRFNRGYGYARQLPKG